MNRCKFPAAIKKHSRSICGNESAPRLKTFVTSPSSTRNVPTSTARITSSCVSPTGTSPCSSAFSASSSSRTLRVALSIIPIKYSCAVKPRIATKLPTDNVVISRGHQRQLLRGWCLPQQPDLCGPDHQIEVQLRSWREYLFDENARSHKGGATITSESFAVTTAIVEPVGSLILLDTAIAPDDCAINFIADDDKVCVMIRVGVPALILSPRWTCRWSSLNP